MPVEPQGLEIFVSLQSTSGRFMFGHPVGATRRAPAAVHFDGIGVESDRETAASVCANSQRHYAVRTGSDAAQNASVDKYLSAAGAVNHPRDGLPDPSSS